MRISTQFMFESGAARMGEVQSAMVKTQQKIASERRILTPSDDPVGAARALEVTQSQSMNTQYAVNRQTAKSALSEVDVILASVTELIQEAKVTAIAAGNGSLGDGQRAAQATELRARLDQLVGLANSRDASGNTMFSGFQTTAPAFSTDLLTGAVQYDGDAGRRLLQVDSNRQMAVNFSGQAVFQGGGQDLFQTLNALITQLDTPGTVGLSAALATADAGFSLALDNVSSVRATVGTSLQELDSLDSAGADRGLQYSQILSSLQDLDYNQALTQLSQQQFTLEAAQRSFASISKLSLFNFL